MCAGYGRSPDVGVSVTPGESDGGVCRVGRQGVAEDYRSRAPRRGSNVSDARRTRTHTCLRGQGVTGTLVVWGGEPPDPL